MQKESIEQRSPYQPKEEWKSMDKKYKKIKRIWNETAVRKEWQGCLRNKQVLERAFR